MAQNLATIFLNELEKAVVAERRAAHRILQDRYRGMPTDTVTDLARLTNPFPALTPNANGEFLRVA